jgi:NUDIX domain
MTTFSSTTASAHQHGSVSPPPEAYRREHAAFVGVRKADELCPVMRFEPNNLRHIQHRLCSLDRCVLDVPTSSSSSSSSVEVGSIRCESEREERIRAGEEQEREREKVEREFERVRERERERKKKEKPRTAQLHTHSQSQCECDSPPRVSLYATHSQQQRDTTGMGSSASVLVPLCNVGGEASMLFTKRSDAVGTHKGHVCFPGGKWEETDSDLVSTALREFHEEMGVCLSRGQVLGCFHDAISVTNLRVTPVLAFLGDLGMQCV